MRLTDRSDADVPGRRWLRLYPRAWRERYGAELLAVLESGPFTGRTRLDLLLGAFDAHVHPLIPPTQPVVAALIAGTAWIVTGLASSLQPLMPDWPGFLLETLPVAVVGAMAAMRGVLQTSRRSGLDAPAGTSLAISISVAGHAAWIAALVVAALGGPYGAITGAAGAIAAISIVFVGIVRSRADDHPTGRCLLIAGGAMLIPSPIAWVLVGGMWVGLAVAALRLEAPLRPA